MQLYEQLLHESIFKVMLQRVLSLRKHVSGAKIIGTCFVQLEVQFKQERFILRHVLGPRTGTVELVGLCQFAFPAVPRSLRGELPARSATSRRHRR